MTLVACIAPTSTWMQTGDSRLIAPRHRMGSNQFSLLRTQTTRTHKEGLVLAYWELAVSILKSVLNMLGHLPVYVEQEHLHWVQSGTLETPSLVSECANVIVECNVKERSFSFEPRHSIPDFDL